jgi:NAD(P)-dependent dehydrogenase (short-subunit alcohol dehydrogenase family)
MDYVLVTGSSSGIGSAIARSFSSKGYGVILHGRSAERLNTVSQSLAGPSIIVQADLAKASGRKKLIRAVFDAQVPLKVLINNAGIFSRTPLLSTTEELFREQVEVNQWAPLDLMVALHPLLKQSRPAAIVNISSTLGSRPIRDTGVYSATKAALQNLTETAGLEWAKDGIRVNSVSPGLVDTPIHNWPEGSEGSSLREQMKSLQPLERLGQPEDIAQAVLFLATDEGSWVTGTNLIVDGGIHLV